MSYFGSQQFFADLQRDFNRFFAKGAMEVCRQAMENQPGRIDLSLAIREASEMKFMNDKELMKLISTATGVLRDEIISLFNNPMFMRMNRMFGYIQKLDVDRVKKVFDGIDKGLDFDTAYDANTAPRP